MSEPWTEADIPDLTGRTAIVTGANSGIGWETARALAARGARVYLACRNEGRGRNAEKRIRLAHEGVDVRYTALDLGAVSSVRAFADMFCAEENRLDILCNNAGIMMPAYGTTSDGFETQIGTNHLGHFALTGLLLEPLRATPGARVVCVSSIAHQFGWMSFDDLDSIRFYNAALAYGQSKLANLLFTYELQRRFEGAGLDALAVAAHPGSTATNLQEHSSTLGFFVKLWSHAETLGGALPTLRAATDPDVHGGDYFGPGGFMEMTGPPVRTTSNARSHNAADARRLWDISAERTGVHFTL